MHYQRRVAAQFPALPTRASDFSSFLAPARNAAPRVSRAASKLIVSIKVVVGRRRTGDQRSDWAPGIAGRVMHHEAGAHADRASRGDYPIGAERSGKTCMEYKKQWWTSPKLRSASPRFGYSSFELKPRGSYSL